MEQSGTVKNRYRDDFDPPFSSLLTSLSNTQTSLVRSEMTEGASIVKSEVGFLSITQRLEYLPRASVDSLPHPSKLGIREAC